MMQNDCNLPPETHEVVAMLEGKMRRAQRKNAAKCMRKETCIN